MTFCVIKWNSKCTDILLCGVTVMGGFFAAFVKILSYLYQLLQKLYLGQPGFW